jgi:NADH:ubiquinone oxidoreductase subunit 6 (subunit J)
MYLVAIAWMYVVLMMCLVEAASPQGSLLGALVTFVMYGLLPLALVLYLIGTPGRKRALRQQAMLDATAAPALGSALEPDQGGHASAGPQDPGISPVGKKA